MKELKELKEAIKTILDNELIVDDGVYAIYWAVGPVGYQEGDPTPYVICEDETLLKEDEEPFYEEHEDVDKAIERYLEVTRHADR